MKAFSHLQYKRALVTGAAGFVGANLVRKLISQKADTHILIKKETNLWRIRECLPALNVHFNDLSNLSHLKRLCQKIQPEIIFHLSAHGGYPFQKDPQLIIDANLTGTLNLLLATSDVPYEAFINTGTSSEYGYKNQPMKETDFLEPASYYAAAKAGATLFAQTMAKLEGKPIVTLRLFSVYGPWEEPTRLVPTVIRQALQNQPIAMTSGSEARDFVFIDDTIKAYLEATDKAQKTRGRIFNICSAQQQTIAKVIITVIRLTKSKSRVKQGAYQKRSWDTNHWVGNASLSQKLLNWQAKTSLDQGLQQTIEWMKNRL